MDPTTLEHEITSPKPAKVARGRRACDLEARGSSGRVAPYPVDRGL